MCRFGIVKMEKKNTFNRNEYERESLYKREKPKKKEILKRKKVHNHKFARTYEKYSVSFPTEISL